MLSGPWVGIAFQIEGLVNNNKGGWSPQGQTAGMGKATTNSSVFNTQISFQLCFPQFFNYLMWLVDSLRLCVIVPLSVT